MINSFEVHSYLRDIVSHPNYFKRFKTQSHGVVVPTVIIVEGRPTLDAGAMVFSPDLDKIYITDGLLSKCNPVTFIGAMGHECAHLWYKDGTSQRTPINWVLLSVGTSGFVAMGLFQLIHQWHFSLIQSLVPSLLMAVVGFHLAFFSLYRTYRKNEFRADYLSGKSFGWDGIIGILKMVRDEEIAYQAEELKNSPSNIPRLIKSILNWYAVNSATHPLTTERIKRCEYYQSREKAL